VTGIYVLIPALASRRSGERIYTIGFEGCDLPVFPAISVKTG